ncbi:S-locus glycoprotein [Corchorus capsularis]|uniref:S-locus glycoprotein n=1 Tax=Corchorus capsularis TaxID=210143 RepID=A0A1R3H636_COCAP|nr:S-locus glycoprotein [Corchorus capsularis]
MNRQEEILWSSNVTNLVGSNTSALLLDSGNLVLRNEDENGTTIWESFQHPSNAFLPNMKLSFDQKTGQKVELKSWKSPSDPSEGNFSLAPLPVKIPEFMIWKNNQPYFRSGPWNGRTFTGLIHRPTSYHNGFSFVAYNQEGTYYAGFEFSSESTVLYYELNYQAKLVERPWDSVKGKWEDGFPILETDCDFYGKCGGFGSCDAKQPLICSCLKGFEPKNKQEWNRQDWSSGCVRITPLKPCQEATSDSEVGKKDGFLRFETMKLPAYPDYTSAVGDSCENQCLKNCSCVAYALDAGVGCMLWFGDLIDTQKFSGRGDALYIRVASSELG